MIKFAESPLSRPSIEAGMGRTLLRCHVAFQRPPGWKRSACALRSHPELGHTLLRCHAAQRPPGWKSRACALRSRPCLLQLGLQDAEGAVETGEAVAQLCFRDDERRRAMHLRRPHEADKALLVEGLLEVRDGGRHRLPHLHGPLARLRVLQVEAAEGAESPRLPDAGVLLHEAVELRDHDGLDILADVAEDVRLQEVLQAGVPTGEGHRVCLEGRAPACRVAPEKVLDRLSHADHRQWLPRAGQALGAREDVGDDALEVLEREELAGTAEARHHLVGDHEDAVLGAQRADALHVANSWDEHPSRAWDALEHDSGDGVWALGDNLLLEASESLGAGALVRVAPAEVVRLRVEHLHKAGRVICTELATEVACGAEWPYGAPVVGPVLVEDLRLPRVEARQADRTVVCLPAARREEEAIQVARGELGQE
mmetsp:Transcript_73900/g.229217  ORF Transcript_73900/g.229217 Transcript_73900/m.229217 type:complete len:427 (-) Transcript_73900:562-1842(-)